MFFSLPFGVWLFLIGLFWVQRPPQAPAEDPEDPEQAALDYRKARATYARVAVLRLALLGLGLGLVLVRVVLGLGRVGDWDGLWLLLGSFAALLLVVQRAEANRRLATLFILSFIGLLLRNYATYRGWNAELNWAVLAALLLNYLFWLLVGRRFPVGSSAENIKVWGMDD